MAGGSPHGRPVNITDYRILSLSGADDYQDDAANQANAPKHRRKRNRFLFICADLERSGVDYLLAFSVGNSSHREGDDTDNDEDDPDDSRGSHRSKCSTSADQVNDQNHDSDHQQDMDESAQRVGADQTKKPEHQQDDKDSPEHNDFLGLSLLKFALHRLSALMRNPEISKICDAAKRAFNEKSATSAFFVGQSHPHIPIGAFQE